MSLAHRRDRLQEEIRVLIVEDVRTDADLMVQHLRRARMSIAHRVVAEEGPYREALDQFKPHVVLADSKLPRFSGRRALRIARSFDPFLPVILVTGTLKEERIVRLTALGLANYVLKDRLLRLVPAVLGAIDRADERRRSAQAHLALEASERRFRAVAEASGDALVIVDATGSVVFWNRAASLVFGYDEAEVLGKSVARLVPPEVRQRHESGLSRAMASPALIESFTTEAEGLRANGTTFPLELTVSAWEEDARRFYSAQVRDVTGRKEEARSRRILSKAVEQTVNSVVITDVNGVIEWVNPAFERLTGYAAEEVVGKTPRVLKSGRQTTGAYERLWGDVLAGRTHFAEFVNRRKDGTEYTQRTIVFPIVGEAGNVERLVGIGHDVTQERMLARQLQQAQKMEAVGQLAGGIAHDFNNILTGVLTNAQLAEMSLDEEHGEIREYVADVISATRRGADLVKRLMSLARMDPGEGRSVEVRSVVDDALRTVRRILPENIQISVTHDDGPLPAVLDEGSLHQALLNLATNSRDAMPDGGRLTVGTGRAVLPDADGNPAPFVVVRVRDSGMGMSPGVAERVFEPFFTTKESGKGTGLGMAMVYRFVTGAGGSVKVDSELGAGTTITLALPLVEAHDEAPVFPAAPVTKATAASGTILLAEDQDEIRRVARRVLEHRGYRVIEAANGVEAMTILARERGRLDLVLADLVMPNGGGGMLYRATRGWPDQPRFVFMSGYSAGELNGDGGLLGQVPFLPKPWSVADLTEIVARALETPG
ncbi:MAG: hypothetical protein AMXMBFR53_03690 [Gemmatimonadota bacterium]